MSYEIIDGMVHITRSAYQAVHADYKSGSDRFARMLVLCPERGATVLMPVKFKGEEK
jgi:hypothetical protein